MRRYLRRLVAWLHAWLVVPTVVAWEHVLGTWEEVAMGLIRQTFQDCTRFLNGLSSWLLSFFQRDYRESLRRSWEHNPWHSWWHHAQARPSTLNALIAATQQQEQREQADAAAADGAPPPSPVNWTSGLTNMFSGGGGPRPSPSPSSKPGEEQQSPPGLLQRSRSWRSWLGQQQQHDSPRQDPRSGAAGPSRAQGAGAPSGPRGPAPASSAPPLAGSAGGRPVIFVQQSGMGILESLKRTGLLEDTRLAIELRVSQAFDWARRTLRAACYLPPPPSSPHAFARTARQQLQQPQQLRQQQQQGPQPKMPAPAPTAQSSMLSRVASFGGRGQRTGVTHTGVLTSPGLSGQPQVATTPGADARALPHAPPSWLEQLPRSHSAHVHMLDDMQLEELSALAASHSPHVSPPSSPSRAQQRRAHRRGASVSQSASRPSAFAGAATPSSAAGGVQGTDGVPGPAMPRTATIKRSASSGAMESVCQHLSQVTTAGDVIRLAGYPLEVHNVTTDDGYILRMERIPRPGSRDAAFFMHGVLDTSMAWVSAGVTGSQAFAAWDSGFDVWLGNSRCNAPRLHQDPRKASTRVAYWRYSCNELGTQDVAAQLERLHNVKCTELGSGRVELDLDHLGPLAPVLLPDYQPRPRSSFSTSAATPTASLPRRSSVSSSSETVPPKAASFPPEPRLPASHVRERGGGAPPSRSSLCSHPASQQRQARKVLHRISSHPLPMSSEDEESAAGRASSRARSPGQQQQQLQDEQQLASEVESPDQQQLRRQAKSHSSPAVGSAHSEEDSGGHGHSRRPSASSASSLSSLTPSPSPSPTPTAAHTTTMPPTPLPPLPSPFSQPSPPSSHQPPHTPPQHEELQAASAHSGSSGASGGELEREEEVDEGPLPSWQSTLLGGIKRGTGLEQLGHALAPVGAAVRRGAGSAAGRGRAASAAATDEDEGGGAGKDSSRSSRAAPQAAGAPLRPPLRMSSRRRNVTSEDTQRSGHSMVERPREPEPYRLRAVGHSLGGMSLLIHTVMAKAQGKPSRVHRLILFTPAGVHAQLPRVGYPIAWFLPPLVWLARLFWPSLAAPMYIPTTFARGLTFKLMADMRAIPSLAELLNLAFRGMLSGDASQWDRALQMPHYGAKAMPACSLNQCIHMAQIARTGRFRLFDYDSAKANEAAYGSPQPPDIVEQYGRLGDVPVDLVAGTRDGVIPPHNIRIHYEAMKAAGVQVTYREFDFGHLDFTFAVKEELKRFLMHSLRK